MKNPEILREQAPDREPAAAQEVVSAYVRAFEAAQLKRDVLRQQIDGQKMERAMA